MDGWTRFSSDQSVEQKKEARIRDDMRLLSSSGGGTRTPDLTIMSRATPPEETPNNGLRVSPKGLEMARNRRTLVPSIVPRIVAEVGLLKESKAMFNPVTIFHLD